MNVLTNLSNVISHPVTNTIIGPLAAGYFLGGAFTIAHEYLGHNAVGRLLTANAVHRSDIDGLFEGYSLTSFPSKQPKLSVVGKLVTNNNIKLARQLVDASGVMTEITIAIIAEQMISSPAKYALLLPNFIQSFCGYLELPNPLNPIHRIITPILAPIFKKHASSMASRVPTAGDDYFVVKRDNPKLGMIMISSLAIYTSYLVYQVAKQAAPFV